MNIEDSKSTLINAIGDLPFSNGEVLAITPPRTQDLVDKCPDFSQTNKIIFWADDRYVILHCDTTDGGDFTRHRSAHSVINFIHDAVILAWANE
jgi:hypothetical protein